jgi:MoaA/NifB/PqqE/SkfB family radical SAM enzyme
MSYSDTVKRTWNDNRLMSVLLELTYACNLDCTFCYNDLSLGGQRLSLAQYRELLDDLASLGVLNLSLTGGEPLAHPRFFEIAGHAKSLGFVIRLKTNGHAVKGAVARRIRDEVDPFLVEVSLHGASAETHDRQTRVAGSFERLVGNIREMKSLGLRVKANSVLTRWNEHDRRALEARSKRDVAVTELRMPSPDRKAIMVGTDKHCGAGSNSIAVDPYGRVLPCVQWRVPVGNLHEQRVAEIWTRSRMLDEVRETTRAVRRKVESFGDAGLVSNFCPGAAHTYSGDPLAIYPPAAQRMAASGRARVRLPVL